MAHAGSNAGTKSAGTNLRDTETWLSSRFADLTHHVKTALAGAIQPQVPLADLEDRLGRLQASLGEALDDVARRSDVDGLREIAREVAELAAKLEAVQERLAKLDHLEQGLGGMIARVADERVAQLVQHGSRLAEDLEAIARTSAADMHASFVESAKAKASQEAERYEGLRTLIEASIQEWRQSETNAASMMQGLGNVVSAQADRHDELVALVEASSRDRRQSEEQAVAMLDTLQDALVRILDRLDGIETNQTAAQKALQDIREHSVRPAAQRSIPSPVEQTAFAPEQRPAKVPPQTTAREPEAAIPAPKAPEPPRATSAHLAASEAEPALSPIDRMRRDLVAEAQRAKQKAAQGAADESSRTESLKKENGRKSPEAGGVFSSKLSRLLAAVLAGVVLINGGLVLFGRKAEQPPAISIQAPSDLPAQSGEGVPQGETPEAGPDASPGQGAQPRSDLDNGAAPQITPSQSFGYGFHNDVLESPYGEASDRPVAVPSGVTVLQPGAEPDGKIAATYQQQVLASLSGELGIAAAKSTPDALLPDVNGRIAPQPTPAKLSDADEQSEQTQQGRTSALKLPPATVGPLSLRLAAANGDPSAQFEVASRLAEGKGTSQNFEEAFRWYNRAAAQGFAQAHYRLGTLFERGLGVAKDVGRARVWYQRAAEQGNVKAMHNLAVLSAGGMGEPDYTSAIGWFAKAAEHGLADSQFNLGVLLENGLGTSQDRISAYKWYALAAKGGDTDAIGRRDALQAVLSPDDLKKAEAALQAFKAKSTNPIVNDPRVAGEDWKKRATKETVEIPAEPDLDITGVVE